MAFDDIPTPADCPSITLDAGPATVPFVPGQTYAICSIDIPPDKSAFQTPKFTGHVMSDVLTNSGLYGPNPPILSGTYGKVAGPGLGIYGQSYNLGPRQLGPGKYYIVTRPSPGFAVSSLVIDFKQEHIAAGMWAKFWAWVASLFGAVLLTVLPGCYAQASCVERGKACICDPCLCKTCFGFHETGVPVNPP